MRFFLPREVVATGPPKPTDEAVRVVRVPAERRRRSPLGQRHA